MQEANAFYDPDLRALLFGYFARRVRTSSQLCRTSRFHMSSHDIIVHETTHAILDGIREYFQRAYGPDAAAFHEVSLTSSRSYNTSVLRIRCWTPSSDGRANSPAQLTPIVDAETGGPLIQAEIGEDTRWWIWRDNLGKRW